MSWIFFIILLFRPLPGFWWNGSHFYKGRSKFNLQTRNEINSPTYGTQIKKSVTYCFLFLPMSSKLISKQEMILTRQDMELFLILPVLWSLKIFYKSCLIFTMQSKIVFNSWNRIKGVEGETISEFVIEETLDWDWEKRKRRTIRTPKSERKKMET